MSSACLPSVPCNDAWAENLLTSRVMMEVADGNELTPLDAGSLLMSIANQQHLLSELMSHLGAVELARLLAICHTVQSEVSPLLWLVIRDRGHPRGTSLRTLGRAERALFYDHFTSLDQWELGPSKPPVNRLAYRTLGVEVEGGSDHANEPAVSSSAVRMDLPLEAGCHAFDSSRGLAVLLVHSTTTFLGLGKSWLVRSIRPEAAGSSPKKRKGKMYTVRESQLRLIFHPRWDDDDQGSPVVAAASAADSSASASSDPAGASRARRYLRLHGGWRMNFSGVFHNFDTPIKPRRISYSIKLREGCGSRCGGGTRASALALRPSPRPLSPRHAPAPPCLY